MTAPRGDEVVESAVSESDRTTSAVIPEPDESVKAVIDAKGVVAVRDEQDPSAWWRHGTVCVYWDYLPHPVTLLVPAAALERLKAAGDVLRDLCFRGIGPNNVMSENARLEWQAAVAAVSGVTQDGER